MTHNTRIRPRDRDAILQSLAAGVVPRRGLQHIQVGRANEVSALLRDVDRVIDGGSTIRFVIGEYGSGKSFFLHLIRTTALEKQLVTMHADLTLTAASMQLVAKLGACIRNSRAISALGPVPMEAGCPRSLSASLARRRTKLATRGSESMRSFMSGWPPCLNLSEGMTLRLSLLHIGEDTMRGLLT